MPRAVDAKRKVFTTGQVARLLSAAPRTVAKWIDSGRLKGYRLPGSQDRRVTRAELRRFLVRTGLPTDWLDSDLSVLLVGCQPDLAQTLRARTADQGDWLIESASSIFTAGILLGGFTTTAIAIDPRPFGRLETLGLAQTILDSTTLQGTVLIAVVSPDEAETYLSAGFHFAVSNGSTLMRTADDLIALISGPPTAKDSP